MKKALNSILLAILIISTFAAVLPALVAPAKAAVAGVFEVSSTQFYGDAIVQMRLYDPDLNLNPSARDNVSVIYTLGTNTTYLWLNETSVNSGEFIGYIKNASSSVTPANPPYGANYMINNLTLTAPSTFTLTYNDASPAASTVITMTYAPYEATTADISFDRASGNYPMNGYIKITIKDLDYNLDPTAADSVNLQINLTNSVNGNTTSLLLNFTETGANTATFSMNNSVSYYTSPNFSGYLLNFIDLLNATAPIKVTYCNETTPPFKFINFMWFPVTLSVASTFTTSGDLLITVVDPNLEHKSWKRENLGAISGTNVTLTMGYKDNETVTVLWETGVGTATFTALVPVVIGAPTANNGKLEYNLTTKSVSIKYYANGALKAETVSTLSTTPATLTTDKTMYRATASAVLTLTAPDLNDDTQNVNYFTLSVAANNFIKDIPANIGGAVVGRFSVKVNGLDANTSGLTLTFIETQADSGVFTALLDLSNVKNNAGGALANGDSVQVIYVDFINPPTVATATFSIGVAAATIELDRTSYPVPKENDVKIYVTVNSPEDNTSPTTIQQKIAAVDVYYYNGTRMSSTNITLTETEPNSGIFTGVYTLSQSPEKALINGWVKALTLNPATGLNVSATANLVATDASISVSASTVTAGDTLTITVNDPDKNFDSKAAEGPVAVKYEYVDNAGAPQQGTWNLLWEVGPNEATFVYSLTIGNTIKVKPGTTIKLTYEDYTPSYITAASGYPTSPVRYTVTVKVASHTGTLAIDKTEYGIGSMMFITVTDPDLNTDVTKAESVTVYLRVAGQADVPITLYEWNLTTMASAASSSTFFGVYSWPVNTQLIGRAFQVYYLDEADASGASVYVIVSGSVKSWDGVVDFDKEYYDVGEIVTVTITDPDRNLDPSLIENLQVTVYSTSDPLGQTITAVETEPNSGVFRARIQIVGAIQSGKVYVRVGDTLTASYIDIYPADYAPGVPPKTITATAAVGVPIERPVPASDQKVVDPNTGAELTTVSVGQTVMLQATVTNVDAVSKTFTAIFKVKDASGATIYIGWASGTLAPGQSLTQAISWTPTAPGTYTIEILVVKSISDPVPYSDKLTMTLTVV